MQRFVWIFIVVLLVLHQDNWLWNSRHLVFGFMPAALLFHAGISVAASVAWYLATVFCWPNVAERPPSEDPKGREST